MKTNRLTTLAVIALVLTLVTTSLVAGTYAKYVTVIDAEDTVTVANWQVTLTGDDAAGTETADYETTFDLFSTFTDGGIDGDLLAPGSTGIFTVVYNSELTEVDHNITLTMESATGAANPLSELNYLTFSIDGGVTDIAQVAGVYTLKSTDYEATAGADDVSVTVTWEWPFSAGAVQDTADTLDGIAAKSYEVALKLTATQLTD